MGANTFNSYTKLHQNVFYLSQKPRLKPFDLVPVPRGFSSYIFLPLLQSSQCIIFVLHEKDKSHLIVTWKKIEFKIHIVLRET